MSSLEKRTSSEGEDSRPGITLSSYPYEVGCHDDPTFRVDVTVEAASGDGRGERVVVDGGGEEYVLYRNQFGELVLVEPAGEAAPAWLNAAIVELDIGSVRA